MAKFDVTFTRVLRIQGSFTVTAKTEDEAEDKAARMQRDILSTTVLSWTMSDYHAPRVALTWEEIGDDLEEGEINEA